MSHEQFPSQDPLELANYYGSEEYKQQFDAQRSQETEHRQQRAKLEAWFGDPGNVSPETGADVKTYLYSRLHIDEDGVLFDPQKKMRVEPDQIHTYLEQRSTLDDEAITHEPPKYKNEDVPLTRLSQLLAEAEQKGDEQSIHEIHNAISVGIANALDKEGSLHTSENYARHYAILTARKELWLAMQLEKGALPPEAEEADRVATEGERPAFQHQVTVQYEPTETDGPVKLGFEFTEAGDLMDWGKHKWTTGSESRIVVTTISGEKYYIYGSDLYDLGRSEREGAIIEVQLDEMEGGLPNAVIGEHWHVPGLVRQTDPISKVEVAYMDARKPSSKFSQRGEDPFAASESLLDSLEQQPVTDEEAYAKEGKSTDNEKLAGAMRKFRKRVKEYFYGPEQPQQ